MNRHINIVVLHDLDEARAALEAALASAQPDALPGLRQALNILIETSYSDDERKVRWARRYLAGAGVPPGENSARAIKLLRDAVPGLPLADAVGLVTLAAGR